MVLLLKVIGLEIKKGNLPYFIKAIFPLVKLNIIKNLNNQYGFSFVCIFSL